MQQPVIATVLEIAVDCAATHQCFTRSDGEDNKILVLKPEVFFERALKVLFKDIPRAICRRWRTGQWKRHDQHVFGRRTIQRKDQGTFECRSLSHLRRRDELHD